MLKQLKIRNELFWDIDLNNLDEHKNRRLIIERIFNLGNLQEIKQAIDYYGKKNVINTLCNLNYLDPKTLNFLSVIFNISKSKFKCYIRKQSIIQHWN